MIRTKYVTYNSIRLLGLDWQPNKDEVQPADSLECYLPQKIIHTPIRFLHVSLNSAQKALTDKLQRVINAAERVISDTSKYDRGLTTLQRDEFHWLDVRDGVTFKLVVMVHQCLNRQVPQYLAVHCVPLSSQRHICFTEQNNVPLN